MKNFNLVSFTAILFLMAGCGGNSNGNSSNSPVLIQAIPLLNSNGLNGNGNTIVTSYTDTSNNGATTGFKETLNIYQQDAVNPDLLLNLSTIYLGVDTLYHRLADITLNNQWATVTMNDNILTQGWVALVNMSNPAYSLSATLTIPATLDRAVAMGNWLLVASTTDLALFDISSPSAPVLKTTYPLSASSTSMTALTNGFFVITNNGYGYMDVSNSANITFTENASADIKGSKKAYLVGSKIYIGGASKYAGKIKVARIDVATPSAPVIEVINDQINGTFVDFSYDSIDGYYLQTSDAMKLYKETGGVLGLNKSVSLVGFPRTASQLFSYKSRFYLAGMSTYRMP